MKTTFGLLLFFLVATVVGEMHSTGCQYYGSSPSLIYLDRHPLLCNEGEALLGWQVKKDGCGNRELQVEYFCGPTNPAPVDYFQADVGCSPAIGVPLIYLDRWFVACGEGTLLQGWRMNNDCGGNNGRMVASCLSLPQGTSDCSVHHTGCNDLDQGALIYLDRHTIMCPDRKFLGNWKVTRNGCSGGLHRFEYTCCQTAQECVPVSATGSWKPIGYSNGVTAFAYSRGTSFTSGQSATDSWSWGISTTIKSGFEIPLTTDFSVSVTGEYAQESAHAFEESATSNTEESHTSTFNEGGRVWQFQFFTEDTCSGPATTKTNALVITPNDKLKPCCLPGKAIDYNVQHGPCIEGSPCLCEDSSICFPPITEDPNNSSPPNNSIVEDPDEPVPSCSFALNGSIFASAVVVGIAMAYAFF